MKKELAERCVELTYESLVRFWKLDSSFVLSMCADDVMWIASEQERYMRGLDTVIADFAAVQDEFITCDVTAAEFTIVQNCGNALSVVGRYQVTTSREAPYFLTVQQRCQFTWELVDGELKIKSMYVSNPRNELAAVDGETFVNALGEMSVRYIEEHVQQRYDRRRIVITDEKDAIRFIPPSEILSISASGKMSEIRTLHGVFTAKSNFGMLADGLDDCFVQVHRSHYVNVGYVESVKPYEIALVDGFSIPVPQKRFASIKHDLMNACSSSR